MQKNDLLTMLDKQSKDWLTPHNIDEKLETELNNLLPPIIASHKDYYNRLIKFSYNIEQGKFEEAEDLKINKKIVEYKNKLLSPLYEELKTIIKFLTVTEENSVFELYKETVNRVRSKFSTDNDLELKNLIERISYNFKKLITLIRLENEKPENKILLIENQLKSLIMILVIWNRYTDVIYKPEELIENELDDSKKLTFQTRQRLDNKSIDELMLENDPEKIKNFYLQRITEKKGKGKGLFLNEFLGLYDNPDVRRKLDKLEKEQINQIDSVNFADRKDLEYLDKEKEVFDTNEEISSIDKSKLSEDGKNVNIGKKLGKKQDQIKNLKEIDEKEIKKARGFEIHEKIPEKESESEKSKNIKKEKAEIESEDLKTKKSKKVSLDQDKRKMLEDEASEIFKDQEELDEEEGKEQNKKDESVTFKKEKAKAKKQIDEKNLEFDMNKLSSENQNVEITNEKLKEYYENLKHEELKNLKDDYVTKEKISIKSKQSTLNIEEVASQIQSPIQNRKTKNIINDLLLQSVRKDIESIITI